MKIYVVVKVKDNKNYAFLNKDYAEDYHKEHSGSQLLAIESEELGWMKQAADAAVRFMIDVEIGSLEVGTLSRGIQNYEDEIYGR